MKRQLTIIAALFLLSACETNKQDAQAIKGQVKQDTQVVAGKAKNSFMRVANTARDNIKKTGMQMREWWLTPLPTEEQRLVPPSYCYQVMQDIVCYRQPVAGMTHQLVGFQGDFASEPPLAQTKPLPSTAMTKDLDKASGEARVASARPVFVKPPLAVKEDKTETFDAAVQVGSEPLPDPMLSPQL